MSYPDLSDTLRDWPYESDKISVRKILGHRDLVKIQMRVELGIIQMEAEGRPDGARPHGCDTLWQHHDRKLQAHIKKHGSDEAFALSPEECHAIRIEASLYYRRYIAYFVLEEFTNVIADTAHSLALFDLCRQYAKDDSDKAALEEFRPYLLMMQTRARAYFDLESGEIPSALAQVRRGIMEIQSFFREHEMDEALKGSEELRILGDLTAEISAKLPATSVLATRAALKAAIEAENFELAAKLRDQLGIPLGHKGA